MRLFIPAASAMLLTSTVLAAVSAHVYRADELTPLPLADPNIPDIYRDIMVGTRLTIFISSDQPGGWSGQLWHSPDNWAIGSVSGRDEDLETRGYEASLLPAAGQAGAYADDFIDPCGTGIAFTCNREAVPGEWFVVDYRAKAVGTCELGLYAIEPASPMPNMPGGFYPGFEDLPPGLLVPLQALSFNHVPSRDLSHDNVVDFTDFALLAHEWRADTTDPNQIEAITATDPDTTSPADLNDDDAIDVADMALFFDYWLERTDVNEPAPDPNALDTGQ